MKIKKHKLRLKKETELNIVKIHKDKERNKIIITAMLEDENWGVLKIELTEEEAQDISIKLICIV